MGIALAVAVIVVRVAGPAAGHSTSACFLSLRSDIVGGGSETYCLKTFTGRPGPRAVVHDAGVMTFVLRRGTLRANVHIVERFGSDGAHATQTLRGAISGGTGRFRGARGTIAGGGSVLERPAGHVVRSSLRYVLSLR
jgi:hypothetical protein